MKNVNKVMSALKQAFPGHTVDNVYRAENNTNEIYIDGGYVGRFVQSFFTSDFDNPEIEIKIKAPLKNIEWFVKDASSFGIIRGAVERGLNEWVEESQQNS